MFIHQWSIEILGQMGRKTRAAVPLLEEKLEGNHSEGIRDAARVALEQIKGQKRNEGLSIVRVMPIAKYV